jgi:hypothetical protein
MRKRPIEVEQVEAQEIELRSEADKHFGYAFGCDGLASIKETCALLGGVHRDTITAKVRAGFLRKGRHVDGNKAVVCRKSIKEYVARMEL